MGARRARLIEVRLKGGSPLSIKSTRRKSAILKNEYILYNETSDGINSTVKFRYQIEGINLEYKVLLAVFTTVFIAELGDKTQLATMLFAADKQVSKLTVFFGASLALIVASGIGVLAGGIISQYISEKHLHYMAGIGFIGIGIWALWKA